MCPTEGLLPIARRQHGDTELLEASIDLVTDLLSRESDMRRTYSFQGILTFLAMSLAVGLPAVAGASESTDEASGDVDFVELAQDDDQAMGLMEAACSGEVEDRCDEEAYEVRHETSVAVFSLKASGPERNEALESSLEYSSLADSGSSSGNSTG